MFDSSWKYSIPRYFLTARRIFGTSYRNHFFRVASSISLDDLDSPITPKHPVIQSPSHPFAHTGRLERACRSSCWQRRKARQRKTSYRVYGLPVGIITVIAPTMYERLRRTPTDSVILFGPRGTGKSTWIEQRFTEAAYYDLLNSREAIRLDRRLDIDETTVLPLEDFLTALWAGEIIT